MTYKTIYVASAGQTHIPFQENEGVDPALPVFGGEDGRLHYINM